MRDQHAVVWSLPSARVNASAHLCPSQEGQGLREGQDPALAVGYRHADNDLANRPEPGRVRGICGQLGREPGAVDSSEWILRQFGGSDSQNVSRSTNSSRGGPAGLVAGIDLRDLVVWPLEICGQARRGIVPAVSVPLDRAQCDVLVSAVGDAEASLELRQQPEGQCLVRFVHVSERVRRDDLAGVARFDITDPGASESCQIVGSNALRFSIGDSCE